MQPENTVSKLRNGNRQGDPNAAPRCGARTRFGCACRGPAMKNGRCRMHGGGSTGARTPEGKARIVAARTIHGGYSAEARAFKRHTVALIRRARVLCAFARARLPLESVAPLIRGVLAMAPTERRAGGDARRSAGNTPYAQKNAATAATSEAVFAMRSLLTAQLSAPQAAELTRLIRGDAIPSHPPRTRAARDKHPMHPENRSTPAKRGDVRPVAPTAPTPRTTAPPPVAGRGPASANTPYNVKPNRAARRKMASEQRRLSRR